MLIAQETKSLAELMASLPKTERKSLLSTLTETEAQSLLDDWLFWARPDQLPPPGDWRVWLILAGRGYGKTRTINEWARLQAAAMPGSRGSIVGATAADVRDILIEGESGLLNISPDDFMPQYEPSKRRLTWPNGTVASLFSADEPDRLRGPQCYWAIADELAAWRYPEALDQLMFGLRLGDDPRCAVATTPRPRPHIKELLAAPTTYVTKGSTYDNRANLAPAFFEQIIRKYEGTRLGRQELLAEMLDDMPGALWNRENLEETRVTAIPAMQRIVVAIDPAATDGEESNETGIVVCGLGSDGHGYVLEDVSIRGTPNEWGKASIAAYHRHGADRIIAESNQGGDMIEHTIRTIDKHISFKAVRATKGKHTRAEPVSALYEQQRCHHLGYYSELEDQLCGWLPGDDSPDRLDALVWGFTELMVSGTIGGTASYPMDQALPASKRKRSRIRRGVRQWQ